MNRTSSGISTGRSAASLRAIIMFLFCWLIACTSTSAAAATEVEVTVSQRETEVGTPIILYIDIINASSYEHPRLPELSDATIEAMGGVQQSSSTTIINGVMTQRSSRKFSYRVTPKAVGTLTIPPITVIADGREFKGESIDIVVSKETPVGGGDVMFVEVHSVSPVVYLGQSLKLTLRVWIKPYQNAQFEVRLSTDQMWRLIDFNGSSWGGLTEAVAKLRDPFGSLPMTTQEVLREDSTGHPRAYYLYEIPVTVWPQQSGPLALEPPRFLLQYPTRLVRQGGIFGGINISEARTVSATALMPEVEVRLPPADGQPATFNGAVGRYDINVAASPTDISVGDPITLTITLHDRTSGDTRLDLLPPPPLDRVRELVENFRMPSDPLAGVVSGRTKTFTQTLRARSETVTHIPSIPFTFFDPSTETYTTRTSEPIAIAVKPGSQLAVGDIVQPNGQRTVARTDLKEVVGGILANHTDTSALLASHDFKPGQIALAALAAPPAFFAVAFLGSVVIRSRNKDSALTRRRNARKNAIEQIRSAAGQPPTSQARAIIAALADYVRDKCSLQGGSLTSNEIAAHLNRIHATNASEAHRLLEDCEALVYTGAGGSVAEHELIPRALACIEQLERTRA